MIEKDSDLMDCFTSDRVSISDFKSLKTGTDSRIRSVSSLNLQKKEEIEWAFLNWEMTIEGLWGWKLEPSNCDLTAEEENLASPDICQGREVVNLGLGFGLKIICRCGYVQVWIPATSFFLRFF